MLKFLEFVSERGAKGVFKPKNKPCILQNKKKILVGSKHLCRTSTKNWNKKLKKPSTII
jgi:hypothetical protein